MNKASVISYLLVIGFSITTFSQNRKGYHSTIWWNEVNFKGKLNGKWFYQVDFQLRTSSDATNKPDPNLYNPFKNIFQLQFRPFFGYQITDNVQFMLGPGLAPAWSNFRSAHPTFATEYRITPQFIVNQKIGKLALTHRYRFELRWFGKSVDSENSPFQMFEGNTFTYDDTKSKYRFRYMFRMIYPLNNQKIEKGTYYVNLFDEIHVNLGRHVPSSQQIDQNRLSLGIGYRMARDVRFEIGPFVQTAFAANGGNTNVFNNHGIQFFVIFNDMKKLFKGEEHASAPVVAPVQESVPTK